MTKLQVLIIPRSRFNNNIIGMHLHFVDYETEQGILAVNRDEQSFQNKVDLTLHLLLYTWDIYIDTVLNKH